MPSAAQIVRDAAGRIVEVDDSIYSPSVSTRMSPAEAEVIADLRVPEPGATLMVAAWSVAQSRMQVWKMRNFFMVCII